MLRDNVDTPIFLMSPPRPDWALRGRANFRSERASAPDAHAARREWTTLADAIVAAGGDVLVCPPPPDPLLTGMIYTAEAGELAIHPDDGPVWLLPEMAVAHRRREAPHIAAFMREIGLPCARVNATWEAQGDAIRATSWRQIVHTWGRGPAARTERAAYAAVAPRLSPEHLHLPFRADPYFHGNTFMNVYASPQADANGLLVICPDAIAPHDYARLLAFLGDPAVHEISIDDSLGYDTNSLQVGHTVIAPTTLSAPTRRALQAIGLHVHSLDLSELFGKGGGAPVCLTNRLWRVDADDFPREARWSTRQSLD